jgi:hypothetical protein
MAMALAVAVEQVLLALTALVEMGAMAVQAQLQA